MTQTPNASPHLSVMATEFLSFFSEMKLSCFYEGTIGAGGHASQLLQAHPEIEMYIGCDRDPEALELSRRLLAPWKEKVVLIHGNFADLDQHLDEQKIEKVDGFFLT